MDRRTDAGRTDGQKNNVALAHPYHEGKSCCKFWLNSAQCRLGGDSVMDGRAGAFTISTSA